MGISARIAKSAAVLAVGLAVSMAGSGSADALPSGTNEGYHNYATGRCLDDSQAYGLRAIACNGGSYQLWSGPDWWTWNTIVNNVTGNCVDDSIAYGLRAIPCNGGEFQSWYKYMTQDGAKRLQNRVTKRCIDDSFEYGLRAFPCNGQIWQQW